MSTETSRPTRTAAPPSTTTLADRVAGLMIRRRRLVIVCWLLLAAVSAPLAVTLAGALSGAGWNAAGSESEQVREELRRDFPQVGVDAAIVVVRLAGGGQRDQAVPQVVSALHGHPDVQAVTDPLTQPPQAGLASEDGLTWLVPVRLDAAEEAGLPLAAEEVRDTVGGIDLPQGARANVTGEWPMWADFNESNEKAMLRAELLSGIPVMVLLVVVFGSLIAAGLPMLLAMVGISLGYAALHLITGVTDLSVWSMNFSMMIGLAVGIDYSLFILTRYRAERARGADLQPALATTLATVGKAVFLSAFAVVMSLSAVFLLPVMVFRSMALGMILSVTAVAAAALTLLPALLAALGDRALSGRTGRDARSHRRWGRWAAAVVRRPALGTLLGLALLAGLAAPLAGVELSMPGPRVVDAGYQSREGYEDLVEAFGAGAGATAYVTTPAADAETVLRVARGQDGVESAAVVTEPAPSGRAVVQINPASAIDDQETASLMADLRDDLSARAPAARLGGPAAQNHDLTQALAATAPWIIGLILVASLVLMLVVFRSVAVGLISVLMNLLTVGAAFGIAALLFQHGLGANLVGIDPQGFINAWAPVFFFALLFGLSMDYHLFLLAAVRERFEIAGRTREAIQHGVAATGRAITNAAVIMVIVFLAFGVTGPIPPTELGITLAIAVILDATVVRMLVVPSALALLGNRAWGLPRWLDRLLPRVTFRH